MNYDMPLFRPPSEAQSLILQVTLGCSHNRCSFCSMYQTKRFVPKKRDQIKQEILEAKWTLGTDVQRVFLADGDAMCLSSRRLFEILDLINDAFAHLQRISIYANARDVLSKSAEDLAELRRRKLRLLYMGLESGDDETLLRMNKGATVDELVRAVQLATSAKMSVSVMVLIGLAGKQRSLIHARSSAEAINRMEPTFTSLLTYIPTPGSALFDVIERGDFELPDPLESIREIREFIAGLECQTYFTCNHASNYLPLKGRLPDAKKDLLALLDGALQGEIPLKPEFLRGL